MDEQNNQCPQEKQDFEEKFPGFPGDFKSDFWKYPKIMDKWWCTLDGSEQKCIDFILRRTWGFLKHSDAISVSQFMNGVGKLDKGIRLSKNTVIAAIKSLLAKGFIEKDGCYKKTQRYRLVRKTDTKTVQKMDADGAKNEQSDSAQSEPTIEDITIDNNQYKNKNDDEYISSLYFLLLKENYKLFMNKLSSVVEPSVDNQTQKIVYRAIKNYGVPTLIKTMAHKSGREWFLDQNGKRGMNWFFGNKKLGDWSTDNTIEGLYKDLITYGENKFRYLLEELETRWPQFKFKDIHQKFDEAGINLDDLYPKK